MSGPSEPTTQAPTPATAAEPRRKVGLLPLVALIYFSVSGGPFGLEDAVSSAGPGLALLLVLAIPVCFGVPCSLMSAELGSALPVQGGYYYWVKAGLGKVAAFADAAWSWLCTFLDVALYPVMFVDYLATWIPDLSQGSHSVLTLFGGAFSLDLHWAVCLLFVAALTWLNARGAHGVGETSTVLMVLVIAPFVVVVAIGLHHLLTGTGTSPWTPATVPGTSLTGSVGAGLGVLVWNYIGWESISTAAGEIDRPQRSYPRALLVSVPLITLTYLLPLMAALVSGLHAGDPGAWTDGDFANAAGLLGGPWLKLAVTAAAVLSQVGLFSSLLLSGARVPEVMAADGYLPASMARMHPRFGTPVRSLVVTSLFIAFFCAMDFETIVDADVLLNLGYLLLAFASLIVLRVRFPHMKRPYSIPGGLAGAVAVTVPVVLVTAWLLQGSWVDEPGSVVIGVVLLVVGVVSYWPAKALFKHGAEDADVDVTGVDLGPDTGIDAAALLKHGPFARPEDLAATA